MHSLLRLARWLPALLAWGLTYYMPPFACAWRVGSSLHEHGIAPRAWREIERHADWLLRYFTGPPSDAELIAYWRRHRLAFEQLAWLYAADRCDADGQRQKPIAQCQQLMKQLGVTILSSPLIPNSDCNALLHPHPGHKLSCPTQDFYLHIEPQNWWRNTSVHIARWEKGLSFIPPLHDPLPLGLDSTYPVERDEVMRRQCRNRLSSLDRPNAERLKSDYAPQECAFRPLGDGWYLWLAADFKEQ
jgi:hypothetical protein